MEYRAVPNTFLSAGNLPPTLFRLRVMYRFFISNYVKKTKDWTVQNYYG